MKFKYHIFIASIILSALLWFSLNLNMTYEIEQNVPLKLNVQKPYAIATKIPLNVTTRIRGRGWSLIRLFTSFNLELKYDIDPKLDQNIIYVKQYLIDNYASSANLTIVNTDLDTLVIKLDKYTEKYVKILPDIIVDCHEGYQVVGKPLIEPDSIRIGGASSILKDINVLYTIRKSYRNINSNIADDVKLSDSLSNLITRSRDNVNMKVHIELTAEKEFQGIEVKIPDIPPDKDILLIPQYLSMQLKGGVNQLAELDNTKIVPFVNFDNLLRDTTGAVVPHFILPEGVRVISIKPEKIQYIIKKKF